MKAKLIKTGDQYLLRGLKGEVLGITIGETNGNLSLKNCQAIERGYDLDAIIENNTNEYITTNIRKFNYGFEKGFQKALEILGDRRFTEEEAFKIWKAGQEYWKTSGESITFEELIERRTELLQQNEWDVEIVTQKLFGMGDWIKSPVTDADGCLILKRVTG